MIIGKYTCGIFSLFLLANSKYENVLNARETSEKARQEAGKLDGERDSQWEEGWLEDLDVKETPLLRPEAW